MRECCYFNIDNTIFYMPETKYISIRECAEGIQAKFGYRDFEYIRKWIYRQLSGYPSKSYNKSSGKLYTSFTPAKIDKSEIREEIFKIRDGVHRYEKRITESGFNRLIELYQEQKGANYGS